MAILMTLWSTLLGKKEAVLPQRASSKNYPLEKKPPAPASPKANLLEKRKLLSTRVSTEAKALDRLDLAHLRARIDERSPAYLERRQRQQQSKAHWFGQSASLIDEAAITKRLAAPRIYENMYEVTTEVNSQVMPALNGAQETYLSGMNFTDINLNSYYDSELMDDTGEIGGGFELSAENFSEMPPLVALDDDIPELEELLARLQIMEEIEMLEMESELSSAEAIEVAQQIFAGLSETVSETDAETEPEINSECSELVLVGLHLVAPISLVESDFAAPVELIEHRRKGGRPGRPGKGKKSRRARQKDAVRA